ncbi:Uncharacterized protein LCER1_G008372, partial [Lachnellula cervina]
MVKRKSTEALNGDATRPAKRESPRKTSKSEKDTMVSTTPIQENLVSKNEAYGKSFTKGHLALPPAKHYAIVTCMDARIDPAAAYGIDLGDAHVIRNAGGNAIDALRSLVISQQLLGTKEILLIKHTGCGMLTFDTEAATGIVEKNLGDAGLKELK